MVLSEEVPSVSVLTRPYERVTVCVDTVPAEQQVSDTVSREKAAVDSVPTPLRTGT